MTQPPQVPMSRHRLALAAAQMVDAAVCYSFPPPPDGDGRDGIWDELVAKTERCYVRLGPPADAAPSVGRPRAGLVGRRMDGLAGTLQHRGRDHVGWPGCVVSTCGRSGGRAGTRQARRRPKSRHLAHSQRRAAAGPSAGSSPSGAGGGGRGRNRALEFDPVRPHHDDPRWSRTAARPCERRRRELAPPARVRRHSDVGPPGASAVPGREGRSALVCRCRRAAVPPPGAAVFPQPCRSRKGQIRRCVGARGRSRSTWGLASRLDKPPPGPRAGGGMAIALCWAGRLVGPSRPAALYGGLRPFGQRHRGSPPGGRGQSGRCCRRCHEGEAFHPLGRADTVYFAPLRPPRGLANCGREDFWPRAARR